MILDKDGIEVTPVKTIHYSNVVTVKYADGSTKDVPTSELSSSLNSADLLNSLRAVRVKRA